MDAQPSWTFNIEAAPPLKKRKTKAPGPIVLAPMELTEWEGLSGKAKWDSQVALRGPDLVNSQSVKLFTTSVIRFRLSKIMRVGGLVNEWLPFVVIPDSPEVGISRSKHEFDWCHFLGHVHEAAEWLGIPRCSIPAADWKRIILAGSNYTNQVCALISLVEDPFKATLIAICANTLGVAEENIPIYGAKYPTPPAPVQEAPPTASSPVWGNLTQTGEI